MPRSFGTTNLAPYASAPAVGNAGDGYFNTAQKVLYLSDGTAWIPSAPSNMVSTILTAPTAASSPYLITHNMSTTNVMVQAWDTVTNDLIVVRMHISDSNHVQVFFEQNAPNNVNVLVVGGAGSLAPAPVVAARMYNNALAQTFAAGATTVSLYDTVDYDTHGGCSAAAGTYTVPAGQPGDYIVTGDIASTNLTAGQYLGLQVHKNGVVYADGAQFSQAGSGSSAHISTVVRCLAGDVLRLVAVPQASCANFQGGGAYQYMTVHRIFPGLQAAGAFVPSQVPPPTGFNSYTDPSGMVWVSRTGSAWKRARDALHARVWRNAAFTIPTANTVLPYDVIERDIYGMYSTPNWVMPVTGVWGISGIIRTVLPSNQTLYIMVYRNGTPAASGVIHGTGGANWAAATISTSLYCNAGDTLGIWVSAAYAAQAAALGTSDCYSTLDYLGTG